MPGQFNGSTLLVVLGSAVEMLEVVETLAVLEVLEVLEVVEAGVLVGIADKVAKAVVVATELCPAL